MNIRTVGLICILAFALISTPVCADSVARATQGSSDLSSASATIVGGSTEVFAGSTQLFVSSMEIVGDSVVVVLHGVSDATEVTLNLSSEVLGGISLAAGASIQVTAQSTGYLLTAAGNLIAFIPNELGRSLLYRSRHGRRS